MRYISTRSAGESVAFSEALSMGLAPDGGLFVPERLPNCGADRGATLQEVAEIVLAGFFGDDPLASAAGEIARDAFSFPIPLVPRVGFEVLELFHGPTAAFKDVGARTLAACMERRGGRDRTILVATSGDTGGAVASAFHGRKGIYVGVLFPDQGVSARQRHQLTCFGDNVRSFAVDGTFDDCQRMLKAMLAQPRWREDRGATTANSINIARLVPQIVYYAWASLDYASRHDAAPTFVVPSGNAGNAMAALWAKAIGFDVAGVVMATNANRTVPDWFESGVWRPRASVRTHANAMDVGAPSNMERMFDLFERSPDLRNAIRAAAVSDAQIESTVRSEFESTGVIHDPHTATAIRLTRDQKVANPIVVATAHAAKFDDVVEPWLGVTVPVPKSLAELLERPSESASIGVDTAELDRVW